MRFVWGYLDALIIPLSALLTTELKNIADPEWRRFVWGHLNAPIMPPSALLTSEWSNVESKL